MHVCGCGCVCARALAGVMFGCKFIIGLMLLSKEVNVRR